jgi:hypothetical protein
VAVDDEAPWRLLWFGWRRKTLLAPSPGEYDAAMGQSLKAVVQLVGIVAAVTALIAWTDKGDADPPTWRGRVAAPAVAAVCGALLLRNALRKDVLPDLLAQRARGYFERDGLSFAFVPAVRGRVCWMQLYFQNRYERPCRARVVMRPPVKTLGIRRLPLHTIETGVECGGASFGVKHIPWPIPQSMQGQKVRCEVGCATEYPDGRGKLVRFREGIRASPPGGALTNVGTPSTFEFTLPENVAEELPPGATPVQEILWKPSAA